MAKLTSLLIRPELKEFVKEMEERLKENDHKPGWEDCDRLCLVTRLDTNLTGLMRELVNGDGSTAYAKESCVDIANYAMMVFDILNKE